MSNIYDFQGRKLSTFFVAGLILSTIFVPLFYVTAQQPPSPSISDPALTDPLNKDDVEINYPLTDHLGSVRVITDEQGLQLASFDYYPYGEEIQNQESGNTNQGNENPAPLATESLKFTGKERDDQTQLDYFGARYLSTNLGRFISADIISDPNQWSRYAYVDNNPIGSIDETGLQGFHIIPSGTVQERKGGFFVVVPPPAGLPKKPQGGLIDVSLWTPILQYAAAEGVDPLYVLSLYLTEGTNTNTPWAALQLPAQFGFPYLGVQDFIIGEINKGPGLSSTLGKRVLPKLISVFGYERSVEMLLDEKIPDDQGRQFMQILSIESVKILQNRTTTHFNAGTCGGNSQTCFDLAQEAQVHYNGPGIIYGTKLKGRQYPLKGLLELNTYATLMNDQRVMQWFNSIVPNAKYPVGDAIRKAQATEQRKLFPRYGARPYLE